MAKEKAPMPSAAPAEDKKRAIEAAMGQIEKMYGKGSIMRLGDQNNLQVDVIPTGSLSLDVALGVGGLPRGRIVEIYGPESSGKTTLALHCVAEGQKMGGNAAFIDVDVYKRQGEYHFQRENLPSVRLQRHRNDLGAQGHCRSGAARHLK